MSVFTTEDTERTENQEEKQKQKQPRITRMNADTSYIKTPVDNPRLIWRASYFSMPVFLCASVPLWFSVSP